MYSWYLITLPIILDFFFPRRKGRGLSSGSAREDGELRDVEFCLSDTRYVHTHQQTSRPTDGWRVKTFSSFQISRNE